MQCNLNQNTQNVREKEIKVINETQRLLLLESLGGWPTPSFSSSSLVHGMYLLNTQKYSFLNVDRGSMMSVSSGGKWKVALGERHWFKLLKNLEIPFFIPFTILAILLRILSCLYCSILKCPSLYLASLLWSTTFTFVCSIISIATFAFYGSLVAALA